MRDITPLVSPRSIAVIGASSNPTKSGGVLFANLAKGGFKGPLYPINRSSRLMWIGDHLSGGDRDIEKLQQRFGIWL